MFTPGEVRFDIAPGSDGRERRTLRTHIHIVRKRYRSASTLMHALPDVYKVLRLGIGEWAQQVRVYQTENGRIRTYSECDRDDAHDGKRWRTPKSPNSMAQVVDPFAQKGHRQMPAIRQPWQGSGPDWFSDAFRAVGLASCPFLASVVQKRTGTAHSGNRVRIANISPIPSRTMYAILSPFSLLASGMRSVAET